MTPAQIRKDLSYFGRFGKQGRGYNIQFLLHELRSILALDLEWRACLVGVGRLGRAIIISRGSRRRRSASWLPSITTRDEWGQRSATLKSRRCRSSAARWKVGHLNRHSRSPGEPGSECHRASDVGRGAGHPQLRAGRTQGASGNGHTQHRPGAVPAVDDLLSAGQPGG